MTPAVAAAQEANLTASWDANPPAEEVTEYEVCLGTASFSCNVSQARVPGNETSFVFSPSPGVLYSFAVRAISDAGTSAYSPEVTVSIPSLVQLPNRNSVVSVPISPLSLSVSDPDDGSLSFTHTGLPLGLRLDPQTGRITGTPTAVGTYNVSIGVFDGLLTTFRSFVWTIGDSAAGQPLPPPVPTSGPMTGVSLTPHRSSPQAVGTPVELTAREIGGAGPAEYRFSVLDSAGRLQQLRAWSTAATHVWIPTLAETYLIEVEGRRVGSTALWEASALQPFVVTAGGVAAGPAPAPPKPPPVSTSVPMTGVSLTVDRSSPQAVGTSVWLKAKEIGGAGPAEYRFSVMDSAGRFQQLRAFSTTETHVWIPTLAGSYLIEVEGRRVGSTALWETYALEALVVF